MSEKTIQEKEDFVKKVAIRLINEISEFLEYKGNDVTSEHIEINGNIALALMGGALFSIKDTEAMELYLSSWADNLGILFDKEMNSRGENINAH